MNNRDTPPHQNAAGFAWQTDDVFGRIAAIRKILDHIGVESSPPKISQARGPPLWDACDDAEEKEYFDVAPDADVEQHGFDDDVDQSVNWQG